MADRDHLEILKQGVGIWNEWREKNPDIRPYLRGATLILANLSGANLSGADLSGAKLNGTYLISADLRNARLRDADLELAKLIGANFRNADIRDASLRGADITGAILYNTARDGWKIDGVKCDYVFRDSEGNMHTPKDRNFDPGEFERLYKDKPATLNKIDVAHSERSILTAGNGNTIENITTTNYIIKRSSDDFKWISTTSDRGMLYSFLGVILSLRAEIINKTDLKGIIICFILVITSYILLVFISAVAYRSFLRSKTLIIILIILFCIAISIVSASYLVDEPVINIIEIIRDSVTRIITKSPDPSHKISPDKRSILENVIETISDSVSKPPPSPSKPPSTQPKSPKLLDILLDILRKILARIGHFLYVLDHDYKDNGDGTITDYATGLMWEKSGSSYEMPYQKAKGYINRLNREKFAGYDDWQLPALEELTTLLTRKPQANGLYIHPIFDAEQQSCWTSNKNLISGCEWYVTFNFGSTSCNYFNDDRYVRAVRSLK